MTAMGTVMSKHERVKRQALGLEVDRIPKCGGWMLGVESVAWLAELSVQAYLADPWTGMLRANQRLGADALITPRAPDQVGGIRFSHVTEPVSTLTACGNCVAGRTGRRSSWPGCR